MQRAHIHIFIIIILILSFSCNNNTERENNKKPRTPIEKPEPIPEIMMELDYHKHDFTVEARIFELHIEPDLNVEDTTYAAHIVVGENGKGAFIDTYVNKDTLLHYIQKDPKYNGKVDIEGLRNETYLSGIIGQGRDVDELQFSATLRHKERQLEKLRIFFRIRFNAGDIGRKSIFRVTSGTQYYLPRE